jgi:hypothetical protein
LIIIVTDNFFVETAAYALAIPPSICPFTTKGLIIVSGVFDSYLSKKLDLTSLDIDLDGDNMGSIGISRRDNRIILASRLESRLNTGRRPVRPGALIRRRAISATDRRFTLLLLRLTIP